MKLLSFLMGILILLLSCIPCSDAGSCAMREDTALHAKSPGQSEHSSAAQDHEDICSPFCQCACCAVAYALLQLDMMPPAVLKAGPSRSFPCYLQQSPVGVTLPVWQPPRLV